MTPKYSIGQFVVTIRGRAFEISEIHIRKGNKCFYCGGNTDLFAEEELSLYTEPKPKVKKWFYLVKSMKGVRESMTSCPYIDDAEFMKNNPSAKWFQRLDWTMTEVPDDNE